MEVGAEARPPHVTGGRRPSRFGFDAEFVILARLCLAPKGIEGAPAELRLMHPNPLFYRPNNMKIISRDMFALVTQSNIQAQQCFYMSVLVMVTAEFTVSLSSHAGSCNRLASYILSEQSRHVPARRCSCSHWASSAVSSPGTPSRRQRCPAAPPD